MTVGEHLGKRRGELSLFQRDVAQRIGVDAWTLLRWEKDRTEPPKRYWPAILALLGYDPFPVPGR